MRCLLLWLLTIFNAYCCDEPDPKRRKLNESESSVRMASDHEIIEIAAQVQDEPPYLNPLQNGHSPIQDMPVDVIKYILGYLRPIKLGAVIKVDRRLREIGESLGQNQTFWFNVVREKDREDLKKYLQTVQGTEGQLKIGINGFGLPAKITDTLSNTYNLLEGQATRVQSLSLRFIANNPFLMNEEVDGYKDFSSMLLAMQKAIVFLDCRKMIFSNLMHFSHLANIESLSVEVEKIDSAEALKNLTKLTSLRIVSDSMTDFNALSSLTSLRTLILRCEKLMNFDFIQLNTRLVELNLSGCRHFEGLWVIRKSSQLENLILKSTAVRVLSPLSSLTSLRHLDISDTQVKSLKAVTSLTQLRSLVGVQGNAKLSEQAEQLKASHKHLKIS